MNCHEEKTIRTQIQEGELRIVDGGKVKTRQADYEARRAEMTKALMMANQSNSHLPSQSALGRTMDETGMLNPTQPMGTQNVNIRTGVGTSGVQRRHYNPSILTRNRSGTGAQNRREETTTSAGDGGLSSSPSPLPSQGMFATPSSEATQTTEKKTKPFLHPQRSAARAKPTTDLNREPGFIGYMKHKLSQIPTKYYLIFGVLMILNARRMMLMFNDMLEGPVDTQERLRRQKQEGPRPLRRPATTTTTTTRETPSRHTSPESKQKATQNVEEQQGKVDDDAAELVSGSTSPTKHDVVTGKSQDGEL